MKKNIIIWIIIGIGNLIAQPIDESVEYILPDEVPVVNLLGWKLAYGDSCHWSSPDYNDSHWEENPGIGLWVIEGKSGKGIRWYRNINDRRCRQIGNDI